MKNVGTKLVVSDLGGGTYEIQVNEATDTFEVVTAFSCEELAGCSLGDLGNVTETAPFNGQVLTCAGGNWEEIPFLAEYEVLRLDTDKLDTPAPGDPVGSSLDRGLAYNQDEEVLCDRDTRDE